MNRYNLDKAQYRCEWFTKFIKQLLGQKRMTTERLAEELGISQSTVMSWVTGTRSPGLKTFLLLLDKLDLEIHITEK